MKRAWLLAATVLAGCGGPVPGVSITRDGDRYVVMIRECRSDSWEMPVWGIDVTMAGSAAPAQGGADAAHGAPLCRIWTDFDKTTASPTLKTWNYGVAPAGFVLGPCQPLAPGNTYRIEVGSRPKAVVGHFAIERDGAVRMIDGDCKH